ncbi:LysR substrate-binding domain-containing protein [Bosea minatitlanensis]
MALFERIRQRVVLTDIGKRYFKDVSRILDDLHEATNRIISSSQDGGEITISSLPAFSVRWLIPRLSDFVSRHADLQVNFTTHLVPFFFRAEFDVAIHYGSPDVAGATAQFLMHENLTLVASPGYLAQHPVTNLGDLNNLTRLQRSTRPDEWLEWSEHQGIALAHPRRGPRFDHFAMLAQAAVSGLGIALMPDFLIEEEITDGRLVVVLDTTYRSKSGYYLIIPERNLNLTLVKQFQTWILERLRDEGRLDDT